MLPSTGTGYHAYLCLLACVLARTAYEHSYAPTKALLNVSEFLAQIDYSITRELQLLLSDSN